VKIYRSVRAEAIILTSRRRIPVDGAAGVALFPQALNDARCFTSCRPFSSRVMRLMTPSKRTEACQEG